jgi:hypothetical protein
MMVKPVFKSNECLQGLSRSFLAFRRGIQIWMTWTDGDQRKRGLAFSAISAVTTALEWIQTYYLSPPSTMAPLIPLSPTLIGVLAGFGFLVVRTIYLSLLFLVPAPAPAPAADPGTEMAPLLPGSHAATTRHLSPRARFLCAVGAFAYICLTLLGE